MEYLVMASDVMTLALTMSSDGHVVVVMQIQLVHVSPFVVMTSFSVQNSAKMVTIHQRQAMDVHQHAHLKVMGGHVAHKMLFHLIHMI